MCWPFLSLEMLSNPNSMAFRRAAKASAGGPASSGLVRTWSARTSQVVGVGWILGRKCFGDGHRGICSPACFLGLARAMELGAAHDFQPRFEVAEAWMAGGDLESRCDQMGRTIQFLEGKSRSTIGLTKVSNRKSKYNCCAPDDTVFRMRTREVFLVAQDLLEGADLYGRVFTASDVDERRFQQHLEINPPVRGVGQGFKVFFDLREGISEGRSRGIQVARLSLDGRDRATALEKGERVLDHVRMLLQELFLLDDRQVQELSGAGGLILFRPDLTQVCVDFPEDVAVVADLGILGYERFGDTEGFLEVVARAAQGSEIKTGLAAISDGSGEILLNRVTRWICGVESLQDLERSPDGFRSATRLALAQVHRRYVGDRDCETLLYRGVGGEVIPGRGEDIDGFLEVFLGGAQILAGEKAPARS